MNAIRKIILIVAALSLFCACEKDHSYEDNSEPELQLWQIAGCWKLTSWNGAELGETDPYCYLVIKSKDTTFEIYENTSSPYSKHVSGTFKLSYNEEEGRNEFQGWYDFNAGKTKEYVISDVSSDDMTWTSGDEVCIYSKCDAVPEDIVAGTKSL